MTTTTPTQTGTTPPQTNTIHDAIDKLFASKEAQAAQPPATPPSSDAAPTPVAAEQPKTEGDAAPAAEAKTEPQAAEQPPPAPETKVSASDHAIQVARAKKKLAAAEARLAAGKKPEASPSADAIKRAAAIEAAGGDPLKAFEAAGLDLAEVVKAYEKRVNEEPEFADPLAREVKLLSEKIALFEKREEEAKDVAATSEFFSAAKQMITAKPGDFDFVAAEGEEGLELVKQLVLSAAEGDEKNPPYVLSIGEALKLAEAHYEALAARLAKAEKMKKLVTPPPQTPKKPSIAQQAPAAGAAPVTQTQPRSVEDVINTAIDALMG